MRRREPVTSRDVRPEAPLWIRQMNFAMHHFRLLGEALILGGPWVQRWRRAQDEWCVEKGCHRFGKSCAESFSHGRYGPHERPCGAKERPGR